MSNPLFEMFGNRPGGTPPAAGLFQNMSNMMKQFNQFRSAFSGNPQQQVQALLQSGKMTQAQFNQLSQIAKQFEGMIK